MLSPQPTVEESRHRFLRRHGHIHHHAKPTVPEFGDPFDEVPRTIVVILRPVRRGPRTFCPLRRDSAFLHHVGKMPYAVTLPSGNPGVISSSASNVSRGASPIH